MKLEHRQRKNNIYIIGVLEKEKTKQLNFYNYKQIKFSEIEKNVNLHIEKAYQTLEKINPKQLMSRLFPVKLLFFLVKLLHFKDKILMVPIQKRSNNAQGQKN